MNFQINVNRYELENTISSQYVGTLFHEHLDIYFVFTSFGREGLKAVTYRLYSEFQEVTSNIVETIKSDGWKHETVEVNTQILLSQLPDKLEVMSAFKGEIEKVFQFVRNAIPSDSVLSAYDEWGEW